MRNLILFAKKRSGHSMAEKLAAETIAAFNEEGGAFKEKRRYTQNGRSQPCIRTLPFLIQ
jgi:SSU ribosomal protein S7P